MKVVWSAATAGLELFDMEMPLGGVDRILRSELNQETSDAASRLQLHAVEASVSGGSPLKSVALHFGNEGGRLSCAVCEMIGVSDGG